MKNKTEKTTEICVRMSKTGVEGGGGLGILEKRPPSPHSPPPSPQSPSQTKIKCESPPFNNSTNTSGNGSGNSHTPPNPLAASPRSHVSSPRPLVSPPGSIPGAEVKGKPGTPIPSGSAKNLPRPSSTGSDDAKSSISTPGGGRLTFFKEGKLVLELSHRNDMGATWVPVKSKTYWPPPSTTTTTTTQHPLRHDTPNSQSVSDDCSSLNSSPWTSEHIRKQSVPSRSKNMPQISFYFINTTQQNTRKIHMRRNPFINIAVPEQKEQFDGAKIEPETSPKVRGRHLSEDAPTSVKKLCTGRPMAEDASDSGTKVCSGGSEDTNKLCSGHMGEDVSPSGPMSENTNKLSGGHIGEDTAGTKVCSDGLMSEDATNQVCSGAMGEDGSASGPIKVRRKRFRYSKTPTKERRQQRLEKWIHLYGVKRGVKLEKEMTIYSLFDKPNVVIEAVDPTFVSPRKRYLRQMESDQEFMHKKKMQVGNITVPHHTGERSASSTSNLPPQPNKSAINNPLTSSVYSIESILNHENAAAAAAVSAAAAGVSASSRKNDSFLRTLLKPEPNVPKHNSAHNRTTNAVKERNDTVTVSGVKIERAERPERVERERPVTAERLAAERVAAERVIAERAAAVEKLEHMNAVQADKLDPILDLNRLSADRYDFSRYGPTMSSLYNLNPYLDPRYNMLQSLASGLVPPGSASHAQIAAAAIAAAGLSGYTLGHLQPSLTAAEYPLLPPLAYAPPTSLAAQLMRSQPHTSRSSPQIPTHSSRSSPHSVPPHSRSPHPVPTHATHPPQSRLSPQIPTHSTHSSRSSPHHHRSSPHPPLHSSRSPHPVPPRSSRSPLQIPPYSSHSSHSSPRPIPHSPSPKPPSTPVSPHLSRGASPRGAPSPWQAPPPMSLHSPHTLSPHRPLSSPPPQDAPLNLSKPRNRVAK